jgi:NAD(P)-dependent dehydrogenase (short-subunit alcohol dehydrogenase family)
MTALGLAQNGVHTFLACRSEAKAKRAIAFISQKSGNSKVEYLPLDLASLDSVRFCADSFKDRNLPLQVLVNNAGIFFGKGLTNDGLNPIFSVNYLGHFLLTYLLLDKLQQSDSARIVMVSSDMAYQVHSIDWKLIVTSISNKHIFSKFTKTRNVYSFSKLCMMLIMPEFVKQLQGQTITINAVHPGFVQSNISILHRCSKVLGIGISAAEGSKSSLFCATASELEHISGKFFSNHCREMDLPDLAKDENLSRELWQRSLQFLQQ